MVECWWYDEVVECWGMMRWWSVGEYERDQKKECAFVLHTLIYNFLASYGSLEDDDPNRYLIDLST